MGDWVPIQYRGFWDVPRIFLVWYQGQLFLFDCEFDEEVEDHRDYYKVYVLPPLQSEELPEDWTQLQLRAIRYMGDVPIRKVRFDATRRKEIDATVLDELTAEAKTG